MNTLWQDIRYSLRRLARTPGFAAVAVLTLALGIGANSAIFTVVNAVLLRPLEYHEPERLIYLHSQFPTLGFDKFWVSPPEYRELQEHLGSFSAIGAWTTTTASLSDIENPIRVPAAFASAELFEALGVPPQLGRVYTRDEDVAGADPVVVVSHRVWTTVLGADPNVLGRGLEVNGIRRTVVGVMPPGFDIQDAGVDLWAPLALPPNPTNRGSHFLHVVGRLAPNVSLEQASAELGALVARWGDMAGGAHAPNDSTHALVAASLHEEMVGGIRPMLLLLLAAVGFVLLIACANVGNLLLAKAEARQKEVAIRSALGAGRRRLARQFLTEAVTLSVLGGMLGLLLGHWGLQLLLAASPGDLPRVDGISLDANVLAFTFAVSVATGLIFGLAPLLHLAPRTMGMTLKDGGQRATVGTRGARLRNALVVSEIAAAVVLVIGSGLMLRSFAALQEVNPGFQSPGLLTFEFFLPTATYPDGEARHAFLQRLQERLESIPGAEGAAMMTGLPPVRDVNANDTAFEGKQPTPEGPAHNVDYYQIVTADYFEAMGIPIRDGRAFDRGDDAGATRVAVINERMAQVFYPGENPIGRRIKPSWVDPWYTIVGIAADVKQGGLEADVGTELYLHYPQAIAAGFAPQTLNAVVRAAREPLALAGSVRQAVRDLDASLPVARLQTMEQNIAGSVSRPRFLALLLTLFAGVALMLAAIGTFGVLSYSVAQRSREIGIRMALGAAGGSVRGMVVGQAAVVAGLGLAIGLVGALALTRLMSGLLFGVSSTDPVTFLLAPAVLGAVALAACYLPARSATRVDPMTALRAE